MSGRSNTLECAVCLGQFDLGQHVPKSLRCMHTFCESCVDNLSGGTTLSCPTCRRDCARSDVGTNFALTDILESLCRICGDRKKAAKCHHCDKEVCAVCLEAHSVKFNQDFAGQLETLTQRMKDSFPLTVDATVIRQEDQKEQSVIAEITETFNIRRQALHEMEGELIQEVKSQASENKERQTNWTQQLDEMITRVKAFVRSAEGPETQVTPERKELGVQCQDLHAEFDKITNNRPRRADFCFEKVKNGVCRPCRIQIKTTFSLLSQTTDHLITPRVGRIAINESGSRAQVVESPQPRRKPKFTVVSPALPPRQPNATMTPASPLSIRPPVVSATSLQTSIRPTTTPGSDTVSAYRLMSYRLMTGSEGHGSDGFDERKHVTCDEKRIYVSDMRNHRIKVYDHSLRLVDMYGSKGNGVDHLMLPVGVAIGRQGELFVADQNNCRIKVYDNEGNVTRVIGKRGFGRVEFRGTLSIAVGPDGDLYVCDAGNHRVQVLGPNGTFVRCIGEEGWGAGKFRETVQDVTVTSNKVIVREAKNKHMQVFSLTGEFLEWWPKGLTGSLELADIKAINCDKFDNTIVSYADPDFLVVLDPEGQYVCTIGSPGNQPGQLRGPAGVAVNATGDLIVCDCRNNRVQIFSSNI